MLDIMYYNKTILNKVYEDKRMKVYDLRCEYKKNPIGINDLKPRLSWKIESGSRSFKQHAFNIQCSKSMDFDDRKIIWDSKKINERELLGYKICLSDGLKAVYLSIGYKINIELALELALRTSTSHMQPEPLFLAHYFATEKIRELRGE